MQSVDVIPTMANVKNIRWAFNVSKWSPSAEDWGRAMALIQAEERERIAKFRYRVDMMSSLVGRLLLRGFAASVLGLRNTETQFSRTDRGRPVLVQSSQGWDYNVSHAGDWVVLAAAQGFRVGVDVMRTVDTRVDRLDKFFGLMRKQFTEQEWLSINGGSEDNSEQKLERFFRHWTLKESYVKTVGTGLNLDLRTLNFSVEEPLTCDRIITSTKLEVEKVKTSWIFEESYLDEEHVVSVAKDGLSENIEEDDETKFEVLTIQQIFGLMSVNQAEGELRIVDPSDFSTFCSKDHPKPF